MAWDEELAERVRATLADGPPWVEQRMFGGLAFLLGGHLAVAASGQGGLLVRGAPEDAAAHLGEPGVAQVEMGGRTMRGWLRVDDTVVADDVALARWVAVGVDHVRSLPPKGG